MLEPCKDLRLSCYLKIFCNTFQPGWYVTVHITNVPRAYMGEKHFLLNSMLENII